MRREASVALLCIALAGCDRADMVAQDKADTWDKNAFFADGSTMRQPVQGAVPRDAPNESVPQPATITQALIERGHERFDIFCSPCHGLSGDGQGMIVQRGFPKPPDFAIERLRKAKAQHLYDVITRGHGVMYGYGDRVPPADRWAVVAYLRALQQSQGADVAALPAEDRAKLEGKP
ncbi:MAG TPA: cytochrome c [Lichenihabitans sp.]|jgi:mono/diheme cytochrome c family protein|nr:cytochrome c [Lichenihabitans sp.]